MVDSCVCAFVFDFACTHYVLLGEPAESFASAAASSF